MRSLTTLNALLLLAALHTLGGCYLWVQGPEDTGARTDQYRKDMEFIPNATIVTEDASPVWELGRHAFQKGTDHLVVVGRYTAYSDKNDDHEPIEGTMRDRKLERVWISIPGDTEMGKAFKLEQLEDEFLTGYDVNNLDGKGAFVGPHLLKGFINLIEVRDDVAVVKFDVEVRPNKPFQAENWKIIGTHEIPIIPDGRMANRAVSRDIIVQNDNNSNDGNNTQPNGGNTAGPVVDAGNNSTDTTTDTNTTDVATDRGKSIVGQWLADTNRFEYRFQFQEDGRFVYATRKGDEDDEYAPNMRYGTYEVKEASSADWVVMLIDKCEVDGRDSIGMYGGKPRLMMKIGWKDDQLMLEGVLPINNNEKTELTLNKANYPDMTKNVPPPGRRAFTASNTPKPQP